MVRTFIKITNEDIYHELQEIKSHLSQMNGSVRVHRKWLVGVSTMGTILIGWLWGLK